jgi:hypothetical protein
METAKLQKRTKELAAMTIDRLALAEACSHGYRSLADLGEQFGVSRERIRQLTKKYGIDRGNRAIEHWDELSYAGRYRLSPRSIWPGGGGITRPELRDKMGLCLRGGCRRTPAIGKKHCEAHLKDMSARNKKQKYYQQRLAKAAAKGLCPTCLKVPPREGRKQCAACAAKSTRATKKWGMKPENRARLKAKNLASYQRRKANQRKEVQEPTTLFGRLIRRIRKETK